MYILERIMIYDPRKTQLRKVWRYQMCNRKP